ncbi:MAG: gldB [Sphingobacteriales bacterium]|nr:gldB [Sphingobacteriales bacterium]
MTIYLRHQIYLFFFISILLANCTNKKPIDVSKVNLDLTIERFDQDLGRLTPQNLTVEAPLLRKKYGVFYDDYMEKMLGVGATADTTYYKQLREVLNNNSFADLQQSVKTTFDNTTGIEEKLTDAFKHVKYYYPKQKIPRLIMFFSGFTVQTPIGDDYIGIGLDMFLGSESKYYPALRQSIPHYISRRFNKENITPRIIEAFVREEMFPEPDKSKSLLSKMIYNGKVLYFMDQVIPDASDSLKIGFTKKQIEWCQTSESSIWAYLLENNLLYETDYMKIQKYLTEAPFTPGIGNGDSAPKLGVWTGWQIVRKYMANNPDVSLQELMIEQDAQKILNQSKYKPK